MKWEYRIKQVQYYNGQYLNLKGILDLEGRDGWELVTVLADGRDRDLDELVFKRKLQPKKQECCKEKKSTPRRSNHDDNYSPVVKGTDTDTINI